MPKGLPVFIRVWFAVDLIVALFPPTHWALGVADPILGAPRSLVYILGSYVFIAASVVAACLSDPSLRDPATGA